jgi:hypothetical protein
MPKIGATAKGMVPALGRVVLASVGVAFAVGVISPAGAAIPIRTTAGQAHAVFESQVTGGAAGDQNPVEPGSAPRADELKPVVMSPIVSSPEDPFCVLDWHVIRVLLTTDVRADVVPIDVQISLDGTPLDVVKTAIKPLVHIGFYARSFGLVVPPGMPTAGLHTLTATATGDGAPETFGTTINVGAADSAACTGP